MSDNATDIPADTEAVSGTASAASAPGAQDPIRVTFVLWDAETDGVAVLHDGVEVWRESSFDRIDQYLRHIAPVGRPVVLEHVTRD